MDFGAILTNIQNALTPVQNIAKQVTDIVDMSKGMNVSFNPVVKVENPSVKVSTTDVIKTIAPYLIVAVAIFFIVFLLIKKGK